MPTLRAAALLALVGAAGLAWAEPPLPEGLGAPGEEPREEPATDEAAPAEPAGPFGGWRVSGFLDVRIGPRVVDPADQERLTLAEGRLQLKALRTWGDVTATLRTDVVGDGVAERQRPDLQSGEGAIDLREAHLLWRAAPWLDLKLGRQILTWGTGDFLFLNDLFPKDFRSFFIGRRDVYLKAPSDAIKAAFFTPVANLDVVYTPQFDPDRYIDRSRLSAFDPFTQEIAGDRDRLGVERPEDVFRDDELAFRLHRLVADVEVALYAYDGFWKGPRSLVPGEREATFDRLAVYGGSLRGPLLGGIANLELAWYDSREDRDGDDPNVPNSQLRALLGFEREVATNLTGAAQVYVEKTARYGALERNAPPGAPIPDEVRTLLTARLVRGWPEHQLRATLFAFLSPDGDEGYLRPRVDWDVTDRWTLEAGVNWMFGDDPSTEFGQLRDNTNVFVAARYGF